MSSTEQPTTGNNPQREVPNIPDNLLGVIQSIWRWRRNIIIASAIAFVGSIGLSLLMTIYFQAETRFLALSPDQSSPETLFGTTGSKPQLYGNMNDIDRLLAIAESNELVDHLVDSFNLYTHYDIDPEKPRASVLVQRKFFGLYEVTKTARDAISIKVEDEDPVIAAGLANAAREYTDHLSRRIIKDAQRKNIEALRTEINSKRNRLLSLTDSLAKLRVTYEIYDLETQMEVMSTDLALMQQKIVNTGARIEAYQGSRIRGANDSIAKLNVSLKGLEMAKISLDSQLLELNEGVAPIISLTKSQAVQNSYLNTDVERLKQYEAALSSSQPTIALLETARVPEIKSRPKRSFVVLGATFVTFIFAILAALLVDNGRRYDWKKMLG